MTSKEYLRRYVDRLSEDEASGLLRRLGVSTETVDASGNPSDGSGQGAALLALLATWRSADAATDAEILAYEEMQAQLSHVRELSEW